MLQCGGSTAGFYFDLTDGSSRRRTGLVEHSEAHHTEPSVWFPQAAENANRHCDALYASGNQIWLENHLFLDVPAIILNTPPFSGISLGLLGSPHRIGFGAVVKRCFCHSDAWEDVGRFKNTVFQE